jgi:glycerophosphoryl diester phosphodiesterase
MVNMNDMEQALAAVPHLTQQVTAYAHRGARAYAPENTLLAFELAFALGADAIECDVQRSRDGHLVIIHDDTVDRTTNGKGLVREKTLDELRTLDAGLRWGTQQRIPLLQETLELVNRRGKAINLEVKGASVEESVATAEALEPVLRALPEELRPRVLVSSFEHPALALLKERLSWLRIGALYGSEWRGKDLIEPALALNAEAIHPESGLLTQDIVRRAHQAGLRVNVWTANSWIRIRRLLQWGVEGIFSDYPERVVILRTLEHASIGRP